MRKHVELQESEKDSDPESDVESSFDKADKFGYYPRCPVAGKCRLRIKYGV